MAPLCQVPGQRLHQDRNPSVHRSLRQNPHLTANRVDRTRSTIHPLTIRRANINHTAGYRGKVTNQLKKYNHGKFTHNNQQVRRIKHSRLRVKHQLFKHRMRGGQHHHRPQQREQGRHRGPSSPHKFRPHPHEQHRVPQGQHHRGLQGPGSLTVLLA